MKTRNEKGRSVSAEIAVESQVLGIFAERLNLEVPSIDTDLIENALMDSMIFVDLVLAVEEEFQVTIALDDLEVELFRTVGSISELIRDKLTAN